MIQRFTLPLLFLTSLVTSVTAKSCVAFDANFILYAFNLNGKDYNAGPQDSWVSGKPTDITTSGRPPFDAASPPSCYLSRFQNSIYVLDGDAKNPNSVYIYDATAKSWSMQQTNPGTLKIDSSVSILDHDTNIFYSLSNGELYFLDLSNQKAAKPETLSWVDAKKAAFNTEGYQPVMALANNRIYFLNVPGVPAGSANIFVIHFSFFQPDAQAYPINGAGKIPATHGQTASIFQNVGVQQEFAFIPDDGSSTFVVNVMTNTTQQLSGPESKDSLALYAASVTALVQIDSKGLVSYLPYTQGDDGGNKAAKWTVHQGLATLAAATSTVIPSTTGKPASTSPGSVRKENSASISSVVPTAVALIFSFVGLSLAI